VQGIRRASVEDIAGVPTLTMSLAKRIKESLEE
jgi:excinuclease UvrABC nuclease subunit